MIRSNVEDAEEQLAARRGAGSIYKFSLGVIVGATIADWSSAGWVHWALLVLCAAVTTMQMANVRRGQIALSLAVSRRDEWRRARIQDVHEKELSDLLAAYRRVCQELERRGHKSN